MYISGELHAQAAFVPGEWAPGTHCIGDWMGSTSGRTVGRNEKSFASAGNQLQIPSVTAITYTEYRIIREYFDMLWGTELYI
jgi:hypothetical protein